MLNNLSFLDEYKGKKRIELLKNGIANSIKYYRSVGYFKSSVYAVFNREFRDFFEKGGIAKIICSFNIEDDDWRIMIENSKSEEEISEKLTAELMKETEEIFDKDPKPISLFAHYLQTKQIEIKIAFLKKPHGTAFYHEKHGIFIDRNNNYLSFSGSANETGAGWVYNYDYIDVYTSWEDKNKIRARNKRNDFEMFWEKMENEEVKLLNIPDAYREKIRLKIPPYISTQGKGAEDNIPPIEGEHPVTEPTIAAVKPVIVKIDNLREHQDRAVQAWKNNNQLGLLQHCTGSGKTVTAIHLIREHILKGRNVIICVPTNLLKKQWESELKTELVNENYNLEVLDKKNKNLKKIGITSLLEYLDIPDHTGNIILTTYHSFLISIISKLPKKIDKLLFIADEAHYLGAPENSKIMSIKFGQKLGLTATPERSNIEETNQIISFFDKIVDNFSIPEAIHLDLLTKYYYYVGFPNLTETENDDWEILTKKMRKLNAILKGQKKKNLELEKEITQLTYQRSRIAKSSRTKISYALDTLNTHYEKKQHWLIFCSDNNQIQDVKNELNKMQNYENQIYTVSYDNETGKNDIDLEYFIKNGGVLLSCNMLNAGIDIPIISHAIILASSQSPIEFIQRRGRVLRLHKDKDYAYIYDPLVLPLESSDMNNKLSLAISMVERSLEFASTCENNEIKFTIINELKKRKLFDLLNLIHNEK